MGLFAAKGYRATTVGEIEGAAGLSPRAGAFYRHFPSKEAVFGAAIDRWVGDVRSFGAGFSGLLPLPDLESELTVIARGTLALLARQRELFRLLARDAAEFPELVARVHDELVMQGYALLIARFRELLSERSRPHDGVEAMAAIALGSLVHYREDEAVFGSPPAGANEESLVRVWVELWRCWFDG